MHATDGVSFWKNLSTLYKTDIPNASAVNGASNPTVITAILKTQYTKECVEKYS